MLEFRNINVNNLCESIVASGYAMRTSHQDCEWEIENLKFWLSLPYLKNHIENIVKNIIYITDNKLTFSAFRFLPNNTFRKYEIKVIFDKTEKLKFSKSIGLKGSKKSLYLPLLLDYMDGNNETNDLNYIFNKEFLDQNSDIYKKKGYSIIKAIKHLVRAYKLSSTAFCSGHRSFLKGINVTFDMIYTQYITKHFQRYEHFTYISSSSLMHKITSMNFDLCCAKYVKKEVVDMMNKLVEKYNQAKKENKEREIFYLRDGSVIVAKNNEEVLYYYFMEIIQNCPMGVELFVHISTNYEQLAIIANQRKFHKLKEDYGNFFKMIKNLPFKDFIIKEK